MNTIVITGAASGLGKAIAEYYSRQGWQIVVADIQDEAGQEVVEQINNNGGKGYFFHCDISQVEDFAALAQYTEQTTGQCNILINNAGVASSGTLLETDEAEWQRLLNLDLMSCIRGSKAFIPLLKQSAKSETNSHNAIVNISSFAGIALMPGMMSYNVAKAAVIAFSESLRGELINDNIHVAAACPAFFKTNLTSSMISSNQQTIDRVERWMEKSALTADSVARDIAEGITQKEILIFSDNKAKKIFRIMNWLYYNIFNRKAR